MGKWLCLIVTFLLVLTGCGTDTPTRINTLTPLTSIVVTSAVVSFPAGTSIQLTATGDFSGLFTRDITNQVAWRSAQSFNADFPADFPPGRIKARERNTSTTVTAVLDGITSDELILTINDAVITALTVEPLLPSLPLGLSQTFTAQGTFTGGITFDLTKDVTWSSFDPTVATISNDFASKGKATSLKIGSTEISAKFETAPTATASTTLTVTAATLSTIAVNPVSPSLLSLTTQAFTAKGTFSDGSSRDITTETGITWTSSDPAVARATANSITALTAGTSTINATDGTVSGTSVLKVTGGNLTNIALTLDKAVNNALIKGTRSRVTARGTFSNNTSRDITGAVTLGVDNTNASVTPMSGNLAWVQAAEVPTAAPVKISASYGATVLPGEISLNVTEPTLNNSGLSIPEQSLTLASGTSARLSLKGSFSSGTQDLTPIADWAVNSGTAIVGNVGLDKGRVHAGTTGPSVIRASYGGQTATTTVTVEPRTLNTLTISAVTPATMIPGNEKQFKVEALYTDGTRQDVTEDVAWTISDSNIAKFSDSVADPGLVVAVDIGTATLTVTFDGKVDTENITVSQ
ncbi:MAG: Ig-like domain-containing protein [Desulfuromonadales bacterium]|nr:Ig-like domain-containing protein [Desulfuromonadales bacterium]